MKFEKTEVFNFGNALRGMRNSMNSWDKYDSYDVNDSRGYQFYIGDDDMNLAKQLINAGSEHRKFLRQIFVSTDITAPMYWWNEFDTYKVGTVANSTSKMHKLASTPITMDCFEMDDFADNDEESNEYNLYTKTMWLKLIDHLEALRKEFNETKDKRYWKELIRLLPESWLQKRTVIMNYENVLNMYHQRKNHKLNEWSGKDDPTKQNFCSWALEMPYAQEFFIEPFENKKQGD